MTANKHQKSLDTETFLRIRKWYLLALAGIALTIIIAQILIQRHLNSQLDDSRVINVAGRQRAFSQKLVKEVLLLKETENKEDNAQLVSEIRNTLVVWIASHNGLQLGDTSLNLPVEGDTEILSLFKNIEPHHSDMVEAVASILKAVSDENNILGENLPTQISILLNNERPFLQLMDWT